MDDEDGGLLNIEISDDEADTKKKADRTGQTEEEFQAVRREYHAKIENGDVSTVRVERHLRLKRAYAHMNVDSQDDKAAT